MPSDISRLKMCTSHLIHACSDSRGLQRTHVRYSQQVPHCSWLCANGRTKVSLHSLQLSRNAERPRCQSRFFRYCFLRVTVLLATLPPNFDPDMNKYTPLGGEGEAFLQGQCPFRKNEDSFSFLIPFFM